MLIMNRGMTTVVNEISKEKFLRKKYIGVLRQGSSSMSRMMTEFAIRLKI
jgi:hypothetical protein